VFFRQLEKLEWQLLVVGLDRREHFLDQFILNAENIFVFEIKLFGPQMCATIVVQLNVDSHLVVDLSHATFDDVTGAQLRSNLSNVRFFN